ncbi:MAG TPA: flippase-like domain-containing protein, partial [Spirochaetia bacterium]|nr:flippase-like domain-containing protein [Spirochaetia bacterium]
MRLRISKPVKIAIEVVVIGLLVLLFFLVVDPARLRVYLALITLRSIGGLLAIQLTLHLVGMVQWLLILRQAGVTSSAWEVFWTRLSGCAITSLTPSMYFGGEPVRASMLKNPTVSYQTLYATIAVDKYVELFTKLPAAAIGFAMLIQLAQPGPALLILSAAFILVFCAFFLYLMVKLFQGSRFVLRAAKWVLVPMARVRPRLAVKIQMALKEFTKDVSRILKKKLSFALAMFFGLLLSAVEVLQIYYVLAVLGVYDLRRAFAIFFATVFQGLLSFIPGNIGTMEGLNLFMFSILKLG